jgi:hypothetical protein
MNPLTTEPVRMGCDPEFFISNNGIIEGAEDILPEKGLNNTYLKRHDTHQKSIIKRDGVQCELNPMPQTCRAYLANEIAACFCTLKEELEKQNKNYEVVKEQVIKMDKEKLMSLSKEARRFGCMPSKNGYTKTTNKITVSPSRYLIRSAGGHIHLGFKTFNPDEFAAFMDIIVGCIGTLLDRDIWAKERRKVYGRAGDYRLPLHGFEYRTLSNFWLKHHTLFTLMFGLARTCVEMYKRGWHGEIFKSVEHLDIETIINNNDINGAIEVYNCIEKYFEQIQDLAWFPLNRRTVVNFRQFFMKGFEHYLGKQDIIEHWTNLPEAHSRGFYTFMLNHLWIKE